MKHHKNLRNIVRGLSLCALVALSGASLSAYGQEASKTKGGGARDPFVPFRPVIKTKNASTKPLAMPVAPPPVEVRIENYKAQKLAAMQSQRPAPKPTTALLLSEMQVIGIFRTPRGFAAMVEATPIKLSYVVYPGEQFYDGQLVAIEETRLVLRRETRFSDGKREVSVETKPLRQPNAVTDSLAAERRESQGAAASGGATTASTPDKQ